jgi:hypothetical protein
MVVMTTFCGTIIRYTCLLFHLISDDLISGVEEREELSGRALSWSG